ncbi:hypothetical protein [Sphingomonas sp.]|uniref:hypothetical protein n=1 Tax=Sphingomonas sp. TaxID=28214 RepID=UPI0028B03D10|nr:hypothetical protein [Sphingomonas sp.]
MAALAQWAIYTNVRFGYSICYPPSVLRAQDEADNGDGRKFLGGNGATLRAFGQRNSESVSLAAWTAGQAAFYAGKYGKITYRAGRGNWRVISGTTGSGVEFYLKAVRHDDAFVTFQIEYRAAEAATYRPIVQRLSQCFAWTSRPH